MALFLAHVDDHSLKLQNGRLRSRHGPPTSIRRLETEPRDLTSAQEIT